MEEYTKEIGTIQKKGEERATNTTQNITSLQSGKQHRC